MTSNNQLGKWERTSHGISGRIQEEPGNGIDLSEKNDIDFSEKLGFQKSRGLQTMLEHCPPGTGHWLLSCGGSWAVVLFYFSRGKNHHIFGSF